MRPRLPLALAFLAAACSGDPPLESADGDLVVRPEAIEFPRTFVGYPRTATLQLANGGRTDLALAPSFAGDPGPFAVDTGPRTLTGGEVVDLEVRFEPAGPGNHAARVRLAADRGGRTVELRGLAETPPPCDPADPCETTSFDPETGACTRARRAEGEACSTGNPCQLAERCISDVCIGQPKDCDDGLNCTADSCDPANLPDGCRNEDLTPTCPVSGDPCQVPVCDEARGCTLGPAPPNTRCGPFTCAAGHVCVEGACTEVDVPDGWPCNAPCGDGACSGDLCVRPEGDVLAESWSYDPDDEEIALRSPIVDDEGRFYWLERSDARTILTSATFDGFVRFRVSLAGRQGELALVGDVLVINVDLGPSGTSGGLWLEAREAADGTLRWKRDTAPDFPGAPQAADEVGVLLAPGDGTVRLLVVADGATLLLGYDAATGTPQGARVVGAAPAAGYPAAVADEAGRIFVGIPSEPVAPGLQRVELVALDADGTERWRRGIEAPEGAGYPVAVHEGLLVVAPARALDASDGADRFDLAVPPHDIHRLQGAGPLLGASGFAADAGTAELIAFDVEDGLVTGRGAIADEGAGRVEWAAPILTAREHALVASAWWTDGDPPAFGGAQVREFAADGSTVRTCAIPTPGFLPVAAVLRGNRLALIGFPGLRVFELPKGETAGSGWTGDVGNPAGGRSAR